MPPTQPMTAPGANEPAGHRAVSHVTVLDSERSHVLLVRHAGAWVLPSVAVNGTWFETGRIADALEAAHGVRVFLQRCLRGDDNELPATRRLYVGRMLNTPAETRDRRWFPLSRLPEESGPDRADLADVTAWIAGRLSGYAWEHPDWLGEVNAFVTRALDGRPAPLRQVRTWPRSSVWRVAAPGRPLIFKASPPVFAHEGEVISTLSHAFPGSFPQVVAREPARRWLLQEELAGRPLYECDLASWHLALKTFAAIQVRAAGMRDDLRQAGCPDFGVARLRSWTRELLTADGPVRTGRVSGLTGSEATGLADRAAAFDQAWSRLAAFGVPETLEHGDFRPGHVVLDAGRPRFFDLSDATVSHPFFSAVTLLDFEPLPAVEGPAEELRTALRASYLRPWAAAFPHIDVDAAFGAARRLAPLHAALVRWFVLLPVMTPREKWEFMVAHWLRRLL